MELRQNAPVRTYVIVYMTLMILWLANMAIAYVYLGGYWNTAISLAIGTAQFLLVFLFFMQVKYYRHSLVRYFACAGLLWVAILAVLTVADYATRNHPAGSSPRGEPVFVQTPGG